MNNLLEKRGSDLQVTDHSPQGFPEGQVEAQKKLVEELKGQ